MHISENCQHRLYRFEIKMTELLKHVNSDNANNFIHRGISPNDNSLSPGNKTLYWKNKFGQKIKSDQINYTPDDNDFDELKITLIFFKC